MITSENRNCVEGGALWRRVWCPLACAVACWTSATISAAVIERVVTNSIRLEPGEQSVRLIVRANHITIDGNGATLVGTGTAGDLKALESAGVGILMEGVWDVTLKDINVRGFTTGLLLRDAKAINVTGCNFSDNYHNPKHGWGELPPAGGILCERVRQSVFQRNRANRVWDGFHLVDSDDNLVSSNDFSYCSNTAAKLWKSSRNKFLHNNLSYGIRIDRSAGEVHARDSTCVLIETGSNENYWFQNDITHGGDGIFIRPLNRWVSRGNIFVENDTSYANNNCVESWSPGNVFIRNKANHGSYGFWLGGSDHTVLIGNEAAFNGLTNGYHNAPEPGFQHGGIVIVGGPSSHTLIQGNYVHHNNGAGIAFRGDTASKGRQWKTEQWIVQQNRIVSNRFGIWGRWGDAIVLAANVIADNSQGNHLTNVSNLIELSEPAEGRAAPVFNLTGPGVVVAGEPAEFRTQLSQDGSGNDGTLSYRWWRDGEVGRNSTFERVFRQPGYYRLGVTVDNGALASLAWRDVIVVESNTAELGTEGQAQSWGFELEWNDHGKGQVRFEDDVESLIGKRCLRFTPDPYPGAYATAVYPKTRNAGWDLSQKKEIRFWLKTLNPNIPGFQNAGPVLRMLSARGHIELKPSKDANLLNDPPYSEARWLWTRFVIPLGGDERWQRTVAGEATLDRIDALSLSLDSWGATPFTVWLDGLAIE